MRKIMTVALAIVLCLSLVLAACTKTQSSESLSSPTTGDSKSKGVKEDSSSKDIVTPEGTFPIVKEKVTLKIMVRDFSNVENRNTNEFTKWFEEKTNVHIEWIISPEKDGMDKLNLALASGDYPDVIMGFSIPTTQQAIYGQQGVFLPLNQYIQKYGVGMKKMFAEVPNAKQVLSSMDGNIYSLPDYSDCFHCTMSEKMWINQEWLDKLGLKMPETTDEFYKVLKAFKEKDPNGNGKADEIPLMGTSKGGWQSDITQFLMNAFIYNDMYEEDRPGLYFNNGKIDVNYNKPEWKDGLAYLHKLYKEGLLAPETFTQDGDQFLQAGENKDAAIIGAAPAGFTGVFTKLYGESGRWKMYTAVPPLKGPNGVRYAGYKPSIPNSGSYVITNKAKHPDVAFRLADALYDEEITLRSTNGVPDVDWRKAKPGELGLTGKQALYKGILPFGKMQNQHWALSHPFYMTSTFREGQAQDPKMPLESILYSDTKSKYEPYKPDLKIVVPPLFFTNEQSAELTDLKKTILDYKKEMTARFITGDVDIDKDWDNYVKSLDSMNLKRYLEILQQAYEAKYKKN